MPLIRKLIPLGKGGSRGVCIPKSWLEYHEKETGKQIESVAMQVNTVLIIKPIFVEELSRKPVSREKAT